MNDNLSRIQKYGRRRQRQAVVEPLETMPSQYQHEQDVKEAPNASDLPSRREVYPSQRLIITRWFFNSLLFIFIAILFMLLWWGISESPWGKVQA